MIIQKRLAKIPSSIIEIQKQNPLTSDLYLCELSELLIKKGTIWKRNKPLENQMLIYCTKGLSTIQISTDIVNFKEDQFCIIPEGFTFEIITGHSDPTVFLTCQFNGSKSHILEHEYTVVRDLVPSIQNRVSNRKLLFEELFYNSTRGYFDSNMLYLNFTFSHLLATFIFASKNSNEIDAEENPIVQKTLLFLEHNLDKKLSLNDLSNEVGYSNTYLSSIFKKVTGYSPLSYFSHFKIMKSCEYLDQTKFKIKDIAFMLGYKDQYYFSKDFQKIMGISPRNYRKRIGQ
jgi:AraC family transcriptional regulator of arabinose operon